MKISYRPEIDGLRAIAVGIVILYHSKISLFGHKYFEGGFIGVDIFFVISGYLITSIIFKELITTGSFNLKYFYERRIRRILPVLLFVMLVSFLFAWMYLLPISFIDFSNSILYSLGFSSNFFFHYSGQEYASPSGLYKPFLHTWSLSVEEQFYIIFPATLLITFKYFRKYLAHILIIACLISLGLAEWTSRNYPSLSFYFLHTRLWELLAGSILAYYEVTRGQRSNFKILNLILPLVGLLLIAHSVFFFDDEIFHPSILTLSSIIGVCMIIWFSNKDEFITKILSSKLFVGIGLISYSLYLWHYPIFAFSRVTGFTFENKIGQILSVVIIFILSVASYYLIEKPFRNKKYQFKKLLTILIGFIIFLISISFYVIHEDGIKSRIPKIFQNRLTKSLNREDYYQKENTQKVVLIGDSHSASLEYNLNEEIKKNELSFYRFKPFMYLKDFNRVNRKTNNFGKVSTDNEIDNFLASNSELIVILHFRWSLKILETHYDNKEGYKEESNLTYEYYLEPVNINTTSQQQRQKYLREEVISRINFIINQGHKLILVYPIPEMAFDVPRQLNSKFIKSRLNFSKFSIPILSGSYEVFKKRQKPIFEILDNVQNPNIYRVYPHKFFCDTIVKDRCVANDKENIFYHDDDHLSLKGSKYVVDEIMKKIKKINFK
ncbi:acyltransferase [Candidatus Pelagibacter ubique]|nr:acyltransferase [Candidatus Pelagibacter ubique]